MHPTFGGEPHPLQLLGCNVIQTSALRIADAVFYFAEVHDVLASGYNIYFAPACPPILRQYLALATLQEVGCHCLGLAACTKGGHSSEVLSLA